MKEFWGWGCRICWLLHCWGVRLPPNECSGHDPKQSNGEVQVMLEPMEMGSTPSLPSLPGPLRPGLVALDRVLSMGQIELNCVLMLSWIVWNNTVLTFKLKSWRQHPTRCQLYGHLPPITKTIQVRRARYAGHCRRSKDELVSDVLLWTPTYGQAKAGRPARTYIQQLCEDTGCNPEDLPEAMNDREKWREMVKDIRAGGTTWWWWWWWTELFEKELFWPFNCVLMPNRIVWKRTVLAFKLHTYAELNCLK